MNVLHPSADFHFLRPYWLLALPVLWALVLWLARRRSRGSDWSGLIDSDLLPSLRLDEGIAGKSTPWPWLTLAWTLTALALAGPSWQQDEVAAYRAPSAWVLVLDLSPSMKAADVSPDRITRARYAVDDLLAAAHDARVGLIAFGDEAYTVAPLTDDVATVRALLPPLQPDIMPSSGDNLAPALEQAGKLLQQASGRDRHVIVLTDGFDDPAAAFGAAAKLNSSGVNIQVIGIGSSSGAPLASAGGGFEQDAQGHMRMARLDAERLQQLARSGGGRYYTLDQMAALDNALQARSEFSANGRAARDIRIAHWRDAGVWLLPLLVLSVLPFARRGWL